MHLSPLTASVLLLDFQGETEAKVWAGFHKLCLDKRPFEKQPLEHYLFSPVIWQCQVLCASSRDFRSKFQPLTQKEM